MPWSSNNDVIHYISSSDGIIDTTSPITPGQSVQLRKGGNEFKVLVTLALGDAYEGTVTSIGQIPCLEANGVNRGQSVTFNKAQVFCVYRSMEVAQ
jgi:hypothetical protein